MNIYEYENFNTFSYDDFWLKSMWVLYKIVHSYKLKVLVVLKILRGQNYLDKLKNTNSNHIWKTMILVVIKIRLSIIILSRNNI